MIRIELVEHGIPTEARAFDQPAVRIGRDPNNDMVVAQPYVSARQGEIRVRSGEVVFQGRATTNPTLLRRHGRLTTLDADSGYRTALRDGDELLFGDDRQAVHLVVHLDARASLLAPPPAAVERAWPAISSSPPTLSLQPMAALDAASLDTVIDSECDLTTDDGLVEVGTSLDVSVTGMVEELYSGFDRDALLALHQHAAGINTRDDERTLLANFSQSVFGLFRSVDHVSIFVCRPGGQTFAPLYACDRIGETQAQPLSRTVRDRVLSQREALTFTINETGFDLSDSLKASGVRAGMCVPMWDGERLIGLIQIDRRGQIRHFFNRHDLEVLVVFTKQLVLALENVRLQAGLRESVRSLEATQAEMERLAFFDPLTGLSNRRLIRDRLQQAIKTALRSHQSVALLYLDLDQFKRINDSLGHESGDRLLLAVANRLNACVRGQDTVARIGGDEFAVLLVG
ncbi:MAG: diguanylate cyclase, partial [Gammaproteobacteria bacterium]|nr:diguanylate cyclase [Gammaproteobacteria bacterium]